MVNIKTNLITMYNLEDVQRGLRRHILQAVVSRPERQHYDGLHVEPNLYFYSNLKVR